MDISQIIVLILWAGAAVCLVWFEMNSRRNTRKQAESTKSATTEPAAKT
jgi:hypothetical protein